MAAQQGSGKKSRKRLKLSPAYFSSLFLIIVGLGLIFLATFNTFSLSKSITAVSELGKNDSEIRPVQLYIPKLAKILEITDGKVENDRWTVADTGVSYLITSAKPGEVGNSVMYGHNKVDILGGLPVMVNGDLVYVVMSDGKSIAYEIFETKYIKPTQVEILNQSEDKRLTIYTCSGFLDQARFVLVAKQI